MTAATISETDEPFPPRYWWLKRITLGTLILLALLAVARLIWGWDADRQLRAEIAAIKSRGEPILPEDFSTSQVPDAENAAIHYRQALAKLNANHNSPRAGDMVWPEYLPYPATWYADARTAIEENAGVFAPLREARKHRQVDWGIDWPGAFAGGVNTLIGQFSYNQSRSLANLVADAAEYRHLEGNDAEALELIRDLFALADALDQQPTLISHLVAMGIDGLGVHGLQRIAPGIRLTTEQTMSGTTQPRAVEPARREQVEQMIALLLDPRHGARWRMALYAERALVPSSIIEWTRADLILRPLYVMDARRAIGMNDHLFAAAERLSYPGPQPQTTERSLTRLGSDAVTGPLDRIVETDFRHRAARRMAAIALATRLYQLDHDGAWPPTLEALVPRYLPGVPVDPLSPDARPMRYLLANEGKRPIVYGMGEDRIEGSLDETKISDEPNYEWQVRVRFQWRDLSRFVPPPLTSRPATAPTGG